MHQIPKLNSKLQSTIFAKFTLQPQSGNIHSGNIITRTYLKTYYEEPPKGDLESGTYFDN